MSLLQAKDAEAGEDGGTQAPGAKSGDKKLTNQFNFSERASQTYNNPYRVSTYLLAQSPVGISTRL